MLSYPLMGALALAIVWVNALLIAAAALKELGPIAAWRRAAGRGMVRGEVIVGLGPGGAFAARRVEQVGRATDAGEVIFADKKYASEVFGGTIRLQDGREIAVEPAAEAFASPLELGDGALEVWPSDEANDAAVAAGATEGFEASLEVARKARGLVRNAVATIGTGAEVFLVGDVRAGALVGPAELVSTVDPGAFAGKKRMIVLAFVAAELAAAGLGTAVALVPPAFGLVSKLGGALCLAYFLGVQPIGTVVRDAVRSPARRALRGRWKRPKVEKPSGAEAHP